MFSRWERSLIRDLTRTLMGEDDYSQSAAQREAEFADRMARQAGVQSRMQTPFQSRTGTSMGYAGIQNSAEVSVAYAVQCSFSYADEINNRPGSIYPGDEPVRFTERLRADYLTFLGYLYDPGSADSMRQIAMVNELLGARMTSQVFLRFREENSTDPNLLRKVPRSLVYFAEDDLANAWQRGTSGISLSRFLVNTFRDLGLEFIAFGGVSELEVQRITDYINMMNDYLKQKGLYYAVDPMRRGGTGDPNHGMPGMGYRTGGQDASYGAAGGAAGMQYGAPGAGAGGQSGPGMTRYTAEWNPNPYPDADLVRPGGIDMPGYSKEKERSKKSGSSSGSDPWGSDGRMQVKSDLDMGSITGSFTGELEQRRMEQMSGPVTGRKLGDNGQRMDAGQESGIRQNEAERREEIRVNPSMVVPGQSDLDGLMEELDHLIGLEGVKKNLNNLINVIRIRMIREKMGLSDTKMSLHLVFTGNPGTGKTTVARLLAKIYQALGAVEKGQLVEVDRAGLVEGYMGQTAQKTQEVIDSAIGGVLFIDEAYTLTNQKEGGDYGQEAVDTLLKRMEDDRDSFVVIVAGYTEPMEEFLESNPGLRSRFSKVIEFEDYTEEELRTIFNRMCEDQDYHLAEDTEEMLNRYFHRMVEEKDENFANAREVRNYFERCIERQANRLVEEGVTDKAEFMTFRVSDLREE